MRAPACPRQTPCLPPHSPAARYAATAPYDQICDGSDGKWGREHKIREGSLLPGKPADFAGELGAPDESGIYASTADKSPGPAAEEAMAIGARLSDCEEYETEPPAPADYAADEPAAAE